MKMSSAAIVIDTFRVENNFLLLKKAEEACAVLHNNIHELLINIIKLSLLFSFI